MKIFVHGPELRGSYQLPDPVVDILAERNRSAKRTYYAADFDQEQRRRADCFLISAGAALDWILEDTEVLERNLYTDVARTGVVRHALGVLERELMLNEAALDAEDTRFLRGLNLATLKPGIIVDATPEGAVLQAHVRTLHRALGRIFFYTVGKAEARVWEVEEGASVAAAAGRIHSDMERGFIRAEVFNAARLDQFRTAQEARSKGLLHIVDRSYRVASGDVIDVKFNV